MFLIRRSLTLSRGVFTQTIPFLGQTSYQKTFRPFKVGGAAQSTKKAAVNLRSIRVS